MTTVAIDFGTSNTVVCVLDPATQQLRTLEFAGISRRFNTALGAIAVIPTLAFVKGPGQFVWGQAVRSQRLGLAQPDRLFQSFKRDLVADFQSPPRVLDGESYTPEVISELFLQFLWQKIQEQVKPSQVILTVPVGAFEHYLDWFREVAQRLQFPNVRLVDESTAAALGYAVQNPGAVVLVVDFGGGTLDLSLVRTSATGRDRPVLKAEVLAKSDAYLGGVDIDSWLVAVYLRQIGKSRTDIGEVGWQTLLSIAELLKMRLSRDIEARESWFDDENLMAHELSLTRSQFEEILENQQLLEQLRQALDEVLAIAQNRGINKAAIEQVLLVGGTCLIPAVQQLILSYFGRQRVKLDAPFTAVAAGALALGQVTRLDDYLRHSYAIRLWQPHYQTYSYHRLFEQGTRYPVEQLDPLMLQVANDGQEEIRLDIGELGENKIQAELSFDAQGRMTSVHYDHHKAFRSLAIDQEQVCLAHLNPPGKTGFDRISVRFGVNADRVLIATVKDLVTGKVLVDKKAIAKLT